MISPLRATQPLVYIVLNEGVALAGLEIYKCLPHPRVSLRSTLGYLVSPVPGFFHSHCYWSAGLVLWGETKPGRAKI